MEVGGPKKIIDVYFTEDTTRLMFLFGMQKIECDSCKLMASALIDFYDQYRETNGEDLPDHKEMEVCCVPDCFLYASLMCFVVVWLGLL